MTGCPHIPELVAARGLCTDLCAENDRLRDALVGLTMAVEREPGCGPYGAHDGPVSRALDAARAALGLTEAAGRG